MADRRTSLAALVLAIAIGGCGAAAAQVPVSIVPIPARVTEAADAAPVTVVEGGAIYVSPGDAGARAAAETLRDLTQRTRALPLRLVVARVGPGDGGVIFRRRAGLAPEAYQLDVGHGRATVTASSDAGLFYGAVSLWQLLTAEPGSGPATLPAVRIEDAPRFGWRGLMLDSARHFQTPEQVEQLIDWMSLHKLNVLHWHLTDDQAWRLEIRKYPRLTTVGAWRQPLPGSPDATAAAPYGGFYSQDQVREVVAHAAARHVTIVPEIEMPGHAVSALLAYPDLGAGGPPPAEAQSMWGGFPYILTPDARTMDFVQDVLTEVMALFPGRYIHVGGDEVAKERWNASPQAQARLADEGQSDAAILQAEFTARIAKFLEARGRRLVGWDEILQGGDLPSDAVVMSWHGVDGAAAAAGKGHDAILAAAPILYFDNRQAGDPGEPPGRGFVVALRDVYNFEPAPAALSPDAVRHVLGVQGNLWTEHVRTWSQVQAMVFPRIAAVAEAGWSPPERREWTGFAARLPALFRRYKGLGLDADPAAVSVRITIAPGPDDGQGRVTLASQLGAGEVHYTLDGSPPDLQSAAYGGPFAAPFGAEVRAAAFVAGARAGPVAALRLEPANLRRRASQELRLCNERLSLDLEGPGGRTFLVNPQDACWVYPAADLSGVSRLTVAYARLPFLFGLDAGHDSVVVHPPRTATGELEVRQDNCLSDPIAVIPLPAGGAGDRGVLSATLPPRRGAHDLCFTFTGKGYDPVLALDWVDLGAGAGA